MMKSSVAVAAVIAVMSPVWMANAQNTESDAANVAPRTEAEAPQIDVEAGAPEVSVEAGAPEVTVEVPEPKVTVEVPEPKVTVEQAEPKVTVEQAEPKVTVEQAEPKVNVTQGEPEVNVEQATGEPDVNVERTGSADATMNATDAQQEMERGSMRDLQAAIMDAQDAVEEENPDNALDAVNQALAQIDSGTTTAGDDAKMSWQEAEDHLSDAKSAIQDSDWQQASGSLQNALTPIRQQMATAEGTAAGGAATTTDIGTQDDTDLDLDLSENEGVDTDVGADTGTDVEMDAAVGTETDMEMDTATGTDIDTDVTTDGKQSEMASQPLDDNPIYGLRADELSGRDVVDANGEDVGDVSGVVIGRGDNTAYAIIEFGGILGFGDKEVAIPLDQLTLVSEDQVLLTGGITEEQLEQFPDYNQDDYLEVIADQRVRDVMLQ